jgi:hypothetical protein
MPQPGNNPPLVVWELIDILSNLPMNAAIDFLCPDGYSDQITGVSYSLGPDGPVVELVGYGRGGNVHPEE